MLGGVSGYGLTCIATGIRNIANHLTIGKLGLPSAVWTFLFLYILLVLIHRFSLIRQVRPVWIVAMKMKITATHVEKMVTWSAVIRARWFSIKHVISHLLGTYHGKVPFASRTRSTHITWLVPSLVHWITFFRLFRGAWSCWFCRQPKDQKSVKGNASKNKRIHCY